MTKTRAASLARRRPIGYWEFLGHLGFGHWSFAIFFGYQHENLSLPGAAWDIGLVWWRSFCRLIHVAARLDCQRLQPTGKSDDTNANVAAQGAFPATRWSVVLNAQDDDPAALAALCRAYWFPLYSFARRKGLADPEDLTQAFFERLLSREILGHARQERGKLRNFLLRAFANFAAEEWRRRGSQKRGGGQPVLEIDALSADERYAMEPHDATTPELEYERAWARELLRQALDKLGHAYAAAGNAGVFGALRDQLAEGSNENSYGRIATSLGMTEGSIRFAAFKLRQRYRATLHDIVAETVADVGEVEAELAHLRTLF